MSPQAKRKAVQYLVAEEDYSEPHACQLVEISRSSARYASKPRLGETAFKEQFCQLANQDSKDKQVFCVNINRHISKWPENWHNQQNHTQHHQCEGDANFEIV